MNQWHELNTSVIHLSDGQTIEAEVNGLGLEGNSGYAFTQGRDIEVVRIHTNEWVEVCSL